MNLEELDTFLELFVLPEKQNEIKERILFEYTNMESGITTTKTKMANPNNLEADSEAVLIKLFDPEFQKTINFLEEVPYRTFEGQDRTYLQKRRGIKSVFTTAKGRKYEIKGLILNATHYTLRTPALIADALLGYGEALDCYAMKLQDEAIKTSSAENEKLALENEKMRLFIDTLKSVENPETRAELASKLFNAVSKPTTT
jgi:hypothetical protein